MPRFTIGSLLAGVVLFTLAVAFVEMGGLPAVTKRTTLVRPGQVPASGRDDELPLVMPQAVDPRSPYMPPAGQEVVNDFDLQDAYPWGGDLAASTW
jgi:hypothetical protein